MPIKIAMLNLKRTSNSHHTFTNNHNMINHRSFCVDIPAFRDRLVRKSNIGTDKARYLPPPRKLGDWFSSCLLDTLLGKSVQGFDHEMGVDVDVDIRRLAPLDGRIHDALIRVR